MKTLTTANASGFPSYSNAEGIFYSEEIDSYFVLKINIENSKGLYALGNANDTRYSVTENAGGQ